MRITKTSVTTLDEPFLFALYSETRAKEMAIVQWDDHQQHAFLKQQFQAQHQHYTSKYEDASFEIIEADGKPVGRLYTAEIGDEIRILDITILSEFRGEGIGTSLIAEILHRADEKHKPVQIYLETDNQSTNLFARMGFAPVADEGLHQLWRRPSNSRTIAAEA